MGPALWFQIGTGGYNLLLPLSLLVLVFLLLYIVRKTSKKKIAYDEQAAKVAETIELAKRKLASVKREIAAPQEAFELLRNAEWFLSRAENEIELQDLDLAVGLANQAEDRMFDAIALNNNYRKMRDDVIAMIEEVVREEPE